MTELQAGESQKLTLEKAGNKGDFKSVTIELERRLRLKRVSRITQCGNGMDYIVGIVQKSFHIVPAGPVASKLYEFTTSPSCRSASIREAGVRLLRIRERKARPLLL